MSGNVNPVVNQPAALPAQPPVATLTITPVFKLVFASVLGITITCLLVSLYLSTRQAPTEAINSLNEKVLSVFTLGCGAIIGLLGGKALN
jgi:hypothetical protein